MVLPGLYADLSDSQLLAEEQQLTARQESEALVPASTLRVTVKITLLLLMAGCCSWLGSCSKGPAALANLAAFPRLQCNFFPHPLALADLGVTIVPCRRRARFTFFPTPINKLIFFSFLCTEKVFIQKCKKRKEGLESQSYLHRRGGGLRRLTTTATATIG